MNSIFTVETSKGSKKQFTINLGADMLDGLTPEQLRIKAEQSVRIDIQAKLRKLHTADELEKRLAEIGFPFANVTEGVEKIESETTKAKKLLAKYGSIEAIEAKLAELE